MPVLRPEMVAEVVRTGGSTRRSDQGHVARFRPGDRVRARNLNPTGHIRLPRYARGRPGVIHSDHGVFVFPDASARGDRSQAQRVYSVRFDARELWGERAAGRGAVYIDLWEDYLDPL